MKSSTISKKSLKEAQRINLLAWILVNDIVNENGDPIEFQEHRFMRELYADLSPTQVIMKGAQVGASTMEILKMFHAAKFQGINQIYTLPTQGDRNEFVNTKVNPIIRANSDIKDAIGSKDVDSVAQKQIGSGFVFFKGTHTESEAIMISSQRNIHDEVDKSKREVIQDYSSRLGYAESKEQHFFSTPTEPDIGIHSHWKGSDQKYWRFDCPHCGFRQHLEWDKNMDEKYKQFVCQKCGEQITIDYVARNGKWQARYPKRDESGYWIPRMICPWESAQSLLEEKQEAEKEGRGEKYFRNFVLGKPYLESESKIQRSYFLRNQTDNEIKTASENIMGIDTGKTNHVLIGNKEGIFWAKEIEDMDNKDRWDKIRDLIEFYDVRTCVIDGLPHTNQAQHLAEDYPYRVFLNFFKDDPKMLEVMRFGDEKDPRPDKFIDEVKVLTSRNRIYDDAIRALREGEFKFAFKKNASNFEKIMEHAEKVYAVKEEDRYGQMQRTWENSGADHYWTAYIYWYIAYRKKIKNKPNT